MLLVVGGSAVAQTYTWKQKASLPGLSRYGAFKFVIGNLGYVGGGCSASGQNQNDLWEYNPMNDVWTQKNNCPIATRTAGSFSINGFGYVVGGIISSGSITKAMYMYDPVNNNWVQKANYAGIAIYAAASFAVSGKGYYGIGNAGTATGPYSKLFYEYDPIINQWTQKASFPGFQRYGVNAIATNTYGYVGFGSNESVGTFYSDWYQYNPVNNSWTVKQSYPFALSNPSSFYINNTIYMSCGHNYTNAFTEMYSYNESTNSWSVEPTFIGGNRWAGFGFAINNKGYVGTGFDTSGVSTYSDFYEFSPIESHDSIFCVTVRPDSLKGKDALVLSSSPGTNMEPQQELSCNAWTCQGSPCIKRALIEFDMSMIPANATFISASMNLYANPNPSMPSANYGTNNSFVIRRITSPWFEDSVTWNNQPSTTTQNELIIPQSVSPNQNYIDIDVTNLVYDMLNNPQSSYGFMLKLVNEIPYNGRSFASSDYSDSTFWPSITYCYIIPTGVQEKGNSKNDFQVYPSLFQNQITVEYTGAQSSARIEIIDLSGQVKLSMPVKLTAGVKTRLVLDESSLHQLRANGMYILRLTDGERSFAKRIVRTK
jgi:hypothetical protein